MNFDSIKQKIFDKRPEVKKEYDALAPEYDKIKDQISGSATRSQNDL